MQNKYISGEIYIMHFLRHFFKILACLLLAKESSNALQHRILFGIFLQTGLKCYLHRPLQQLRTRRSRLPYGWSLDGISKIAGNAWSCSSIKCRISSATWLTWFKLVAKFTDVTGAEFKFILTCWFIRMIAISFRFVNAVNVSSIWRSGVSGHSGC